MRSKIKDFLIISITTLIIFLTTDFLIGNKILTVLNFNKDETFRIPNEFYHHGFKKNYQTNNAYWGPHKYKFCTNEFGTRDDCSNTPSKKFNYAFIGDSQTEGVGLNFNDTYVGNFAKRTGEKVLNFGIIRSSPSLYLKRLKFFLNQKIHFNELFILIDLSDLHDEIRYNEDIFINDNLNVCKSINPNNKPRKSKKISNSSFKFKKIIKEDFKILYTSLELIWWKLNFKKFYSSYTYDYLKKNYYRSGWVYNDNHPNFGGPDCLDYIIKSTKNIVDEIYNLLNLYNIKMSIIVAPWPSNILHDNGVSKHALIWKDYCKTKCNNFINLFPYFYDYSNRKGKMNTINDHFFDYDVHYNKYANKIIADHIIKSVNE